jgi:D-aminopeptidase
MRTFVCLTWLLIAMGPGFAEERRPRFRELGVNVGILPPGKLNAITDVAGVKVGHKTLISGANVRTGVTAILPHERNLYREKVPAAVSVGNGFGKLMGSTQVRELGEIETPILLTNTLCVGRVADALLDRLLSLPENKSVRSINPIVAETNDGFLNDIAARNITPADVCAALDAAKGGAVDEGCVGAGTGTMAFGFKAGIGTSSRIVNNPTGSYTVGVLVQSNFNGILTMAGAPVGRELGKFYLKQKTEPNDQRNPPDGSIIIVIATDAPVNPRNLERMASRAMLGMARTGGLALNGSGDYAIAFSTANLIRRDERLRNVHELSNDAMSPLFLAVIEATEEAIYNSLCKATSMVGRDGHTAEAIPISETIAILRKHGVPVNAK